MALVNATEAWSINHDIRRIKLPLSLKTRAQLNSLKAAGFNIEGELKDKLYINGQYFNKYVMAKLLI